MNRFALFFALALLTLSPFASADIPHLISLQGKLTDASDNPVSSSTNFAFRIYDASTGGNALWTEFQTITPGTLGIFSALLGSVTALNIPFNTSYWLEVQVNSEILSPRTRMGSAGYAIRSESPWNATGNNIYTTNAGNVGIGTASPRQKLDVYGGNAIFTPNTVNDGTLKIKNSVNGEVDLQARNNADTLNGALALNPDGGNVGIGTTNPTTGKLVVSGGNIDATGNKVINLAAPTASADAVTKAYVDALGGGSGGSLFIPAGTYFLYGAGGAGDTAGQSVYYCLQKVVSGTGGITNTAINQNQPCDLSSSSKKCYNGNCITIIGLTYSGATHVELDCTGAGGTVYNTGGSGTLCRFAAASCPAGWVQADNWQTYSVATWGGDACGAQKSYGPTAFSNSIAYVYSRGSSAGGSCGSACCAAGGNKWFYSSTGYDYVASTVNPTTNRVEVGCK